MENASIDSRPHYHFDCFSTFPTTTFVNDTGVSITPTTDETCRLHCSEESATFSCEEEVTSLNNVTDKNMLCSRGNVCNLE